ncbi:like-Sm protein [Medicago truncatula]|uniref:Like-Sm protein n=1 Tax=Medicago truncatula TaxID=3880 RepID=G7IAD2_MEDTR|nr:like-Sm protein [Medicago truncatula]
MCLSEVINVYIYQSFNYSGRDNFNDGRNIVGVLKGFDQATNIILVESHERTRLFYQGMNSILTVVGKLDEDLDSSLDLSKLRAHPLKPVIH